MDRTQCKMARAALGWRARDLADSAKVGTATIARFELGSDIADESLRRLEAAFTAAGVRFIGGGVYKGGVCPPSP